MRSACSFRCSSRPLFPASVIRSPCHDCTCTCARNACIRKRFHTGRQCRSRSTSSPVSSPLCTCSSSTDSSCSIASRSSVIVLTKPNDLTPFSAYHTAECPGTRVLGVVRRRREIRRADPAPAEYGTKDCRAPCRLYCTPVWRTRAGNFAFFRGVHNAPRERHAKMAGRLSFNLLQDDVEDNTDLTPAAPPVVATPEPAAAAPVAVAAESRNVSFGERGGRGWREGAGDFGGRGRRGVRGGRGRGGRGRGMRGRGGRGGFGGGGPGSWDARGNDERGNIDAPQRKSEDIAPQLTTEELVPVELKAENDDETKEEGAPDVEKEDARPPQPPKEKEMTLDEYMAKKAAMQQEMRSLSTKSTRKANDGQVGYGGKMAVLKKKIDGNQEADETSIMSSVQMKQIVENRSTKDSTHAAVADNAKNQEFFKTPARSSGPRSYQGRDARVNANGDFRRGGDRQNTGFKGGSRGGRYEGGENRNRGPSYNRSNEDYRGNRDSYNRQRSGAPNVDDQSAFPSLSA